MAHRDPRILRIQTTDDMKMILLAKGKPLESFRAGDTIEAWNKMKKGYSYKLSVDPGTHFDPEFKPYASPGEILASGAFEGKYLNDCLLEFPAEWFWNAIQAGKLSPGGARVDLNLFQIHSRQGLDAWKKAGWVPGCVEGPCKKGLYTELSDPRKNPDERGWFQWYCRYWMGRRLPELDQIQIKRWKAFTRHQGQIKANCQPGDIGCRPRQRQGLFHWAHDPFM